MLLRLLMIPLAIGLLALSLYTYAVMAGIPPEPAPSGSRGSGAAQAVLASKPLNADGFYALGVAAERSGNLTQARTVIERADQLDPRRAAFQIWLFTDAAQNGDIPKALALAERIARLNPAASSAISGFLGQLARDPIARREIATRFGDTPLILDVAASAAQQGSGLDVVQGLLRGTDVAALPDGLARAQSALTGPLLKEGRVAEARTVWLRVAGIKSTVSVYDGTFASLPGAAPFGWTLRNEADIQAAIESDAGPARSGALRVTSFGSLTADAAEQSLALAPGSYRLAFSASSADQDPGEPAFAWSIRCGTGAPFVEMIVDTPVSGWGARSSKFAVPSDCPLQTLKLAKLATTTQKSRTILISQVAVTPD